MTPQRKCLIKKQARTILEDNQILEPPVPVEKIAKALGANLRFSPLDDELSGMIYIKDCKPIIGINALHHPNRRRFTIAHECGHLILHRALIKKEVHVDKAFPMLMRDSISSSGVNNMEIEANHFAAELLMPESLLIFAIGGKTFDIDDEGVVTAFAKNFQVSTAAMRFRLGKLIV
ncbi:MAG: ImmA/IrrE family metallo-endopeptidase [Gammaproteobacteria bacterium]|nr:ImmA/IrrE family metallo-endopeptidase [Gammaproteobacteria bacterium]